MIKILSIILLVVLLVILLIYLFNTSLFNKYFNITSLPIQEDKINEYNNKIRSLEENLREKYENKLFQPDLQPEFQSQLQPEFEPELQSQLPEEIFVNEDLNQFNEINNLEELFELYYRGIYSTYDIDGNMIPGIEPNASMSINILKELFNLTNDYHYLFRLAQLIQRGMHNYAPNNKLAIDYYNYIIMNSNDQQVRNEAFTELIEINSEEEVHLNPIIQEYNNENNDIVIIKNYGTSVEEQQKIIDELKHYNDPQNTHDSGIITTTRNFIKKLNEENNQENGQENSKERVFQEIYNKISEKPDSDKKRNALKSLEYMIENNVTNQSLEINELELLKDVYKKLPEENFDILYENLSDMQEHGNTVCSTGRVTRIASTLNVIDPDVKIIPMYALKEEMLNRGAKIRETSGLEDDELKNEIRNTLRKEYLDTGLINEKTFLKETEWINYL